ncbi:MAG: ATP-dependent helicase [Haliscomenobacteraceae bacterium CHB4]|nr:ATP-dependent RNA helicase DeaD [Saprospiraceae bacterium]MCE7922705.1 ATP-dependent helicase [Haliscomenobacteraceae bacterium CHB4]
MTAFKNLGIDYDLLQGIAALGFETPTPVQELVIPTALTSDTDIIALAHTGTGKTAAFGLPLLQRIEPSERGVQALIMCPTRELCVQVANDLVNYSQYAHQYKVVAVYGGAGIEGQIRQIKAGAQIIVATPGRLMDLMTRKAVRLDGVRRVVLDEADEMLNMGFKEAIDFILAAAENRESIWLFSATMPNEVRAIAADYMENPKELSTGKHNQANESIEHIYYVCRADDRYAALKRVVDANPGIYALIFCRTKIEAKEIAEQMIRDGYNSDALHGDLAQADRDRVMQRFREGNLQLLIATDVAARGLDVSNISHVINYGLPDEIEVYTHRSGRTGRAGRTGVSISIVTPKFEERIRQIERKTKATFTKKPIPTGIEVCEQQLYQIVNNIHNQEVHHEEIEPYMARINEELKDLSKEELIKRFASVEFNRFLAYYRNAPDINVYPKGDKRGARAHTGGQVNGQMTRLFANIGEIDGVSKKDFIKLLSRTFGVPTQAIGHIDLNRAYMHFDLDAAYVNVVRQGLSEFNINGRRIRLDDASAKKDKPSKEDRFFDKWEKKGGKKKGKKW